MNNQSIRKHRMRKQVGTKRRGAAFVLLVVAILMVVLGAWQALLRGEVSSRRNDRDRAQSITMARAIEVASSLKTQDAVVLPVDESTKQEIKVAPNDDKTLWVANWIMDGEIVKTISRPMKQQP